MAVWVFRTYDLPLRGFLLCPNCGKQLTGSASKGRSNYYHYYHCNSACGFRHKAPDVNEKIIAEIRQYVTPLPRLMHYREVIVSTFKAQTNTQRTNAQQLKMQLEEEGKRISRARDLLLAGDIDASDYRLIKAESEEKIQRMEAMLAASVVEKISIEPLLDSAISNIANLDLLYKDGTVLQKRKINHKSQ